MLNLNSGSSFENSGGPGAVKAARQYPCSRHWLRPENSIDEEVESEINTNPQAEPPVPRVFGPRPLRVCHCPYLFTTLRSIYFIFSLCDNFSETKVLDESCYSALQSLRRREGRSPQRQDSLHREARGEPSSSPPSLNIHAGSSCASLAPAVPNSEN